MSKFPIDLSQFKKTKEDHAFTTLKHAKGHEIRIAHAALSKDNQKQLKKLPMALAEGGDTSDSPFKEKPDDYFYNHAPEQPKAEKDQENKDEAAAKRRKEGTSSMGSAFGYAEGGEVDPYAAIKKEDYKKYANGGEIDCTHPKTRSEANVCGRDPDTAVSDTEEDKAASVSAKRAAGSSSLSSAFGYAEGGDVSQQPPVTINLNASGQPTANIDPSQLNPKFANTPPSPQQPVTPPPTQTPQQTPTDPYGVQSQQEALQKGLGMQMAAQDLGAGGVQQMAKAQANILQQQINQQNQQLDLAKQHYAQYDQDSKQILDNINSQQIDPNRVWSNKSIPSKISTVIGLALGGMGAGILHQENPVLKMLNQQIANDLDAQKTNLGKEQNLYSALNQHYGNQVEADNMFKVIQNQQVASMLDKAGAQAKTPQAQAAAMQTKGQILAQNAQMLGHMAAMKTALGGGQDGMTTQPSQMDPAQAVPFLVPPDQQKEVFKEISQAQNSVKNKAAFLQAFDQADQENSILGRIGRLGFTPPSIKAMNMYALPLIHDLEGRVNEYEQKTVQDNMPSPGDKPDTVARKRQAMEQFFDQKSAAPTAKGFGIDLSKYYEQPSQQTGGQQTSPQVKTVNGVKYQKVTGGWKKVQ